MIIFDYAMLNSNNEVGCFLTLTIETVQVAVLDTLAVQLIAAVNYSACVMVLIIYIKFCLQLMLLQK